LMRALGAGSGGHASRLLFWGELIRVNEQPRAMFRANMAAVLAVLGCPEIVNLEWDALRDYGYG
jgi:hypothetical protein